MKMEHFLIYAAVFLCGAFALYVLQQLIGFVDKTKSRGYPNTMDTTLIRQMIEQYRGNHLNAINSALGVDDANSATFGLKTLKKFIADIEYQTKKRNPAIGIGALGIRFYYAAYPKDSEWGNLENEKSVGKDYAGKHTLIMIPTLKKKINRGSTLDYDFNPLDESTFLPGEHEKERPVARMAMDTADSSDRQSTQVMAQNHGQLIPPAESDQQLY